MLAFANTEFVALCQAQLALVTQGLGASLGVIYLTQPTAEEGEPPLVPVASYPESGIDWAQLLATALHFEQNLSSDKPQLLASPSSEQGWQTRQAEPLSQQYPSLAEESPSASQSCNLHPTVAQQQVVLPLLHQETVLGLLVVGREDRPWDRWEQTQLKQVARTLTLGCVLDQRYQWLSREQQQQQQIKAQQYDRLDNLLHQLRNSLTALQTFGKLLLRRLLPGDANQDVASSLLRETDRLRQLSQQIEGVLSTERQATLLETSLPPAAIAPLALPAAETPPDFTAGLLAGTPLPLQPCAISTVLTPLLASQGAIAQAKHRFLYQQIPADLPLVQANAQALHEVLNNLLENALKYTPAGGAVLVTVTVQPPDWLEIWISDTGPGIPSEDLPHIFERYYRGVQSASTIPGTGLGLAIAWDLVNQMQGEIQLLSPAPAEVWQVLQPIAIRPTTPGTTFIVRLPLATSVAQGSDLGSVDED